MAEETPIEWTRCPTTGRQGATWSPVTGCTDADESCLYCYAKKLTATRLRNQPKYQGLASMGKRGPQWSGDVRLHPEILSQPLKWKGRRRIFVCSMSDLFHKDVPVDFIAQVWASMAWSYMIRGHLHLCLTKRAERAFGILSDPVFRDRVGGHMAETRPAHKPPFAGERPLAWPLAGIHLGVSAGRYQELAERWAYLRRTPVQARFLSIEPLIGDVRLFRALRIPDTREKRKDVQCHLPDQIIAGGESGVRSRCRPPHPRWLYDLRDDCDRLGILDRFFLKQWGNWSPWPCGDRRREIVVLRNGSTYTQGEISRGEIDEVHRGPFDGWARDLDPQLMSFCTKKEAGRELAGQAFNGYPDACPSCYEPFDTYDSRHGCPGCGGMVCDACKVDSENREAVCTGRCRGCWKDQATSTAVVKGRAASARTTSISR